MRTDFDTTAKIVSLILKAFGLPTGLFSIVSDVTSIGIKIAKQNKRSKKECFIQELVKSVGKITWNENNYEDVKEKVLVTLADEKCFSAKRILHYYKREKDYSIELTEELYGKSAETDPSAEGYQRAMEQILDPVYSNLPLLEVASNAEEAILGKLYSFETLAKERDSMLEALKYKDSFAEYIDNAELPRFFDKQDNVFSYRSSQIGFYGRKRELDRLGVFVKQPNISIWGIAGPGGCGKSKLARYFAIKEKYHRQPVWLDQTAFSQLCSRSECNYPSPILFICDYAAQFEKPLIELVQMLSKKPIDAKILLLERQPVWYTNFLNSSEACEINEYAYLKEPIDLTNADLSDDDSEANEVYSKIIKDLAKSEHPSSENPAVKEKNYKKNTLNQDECNYIIKTAKTLSINKQPVRCLFLLLVADAYLRDGTITELDADALLKNYFDHSETIISNRYKRTEGAKDKLIRAGYNILAFATASDGIKLENEPSEICDKLKIVDRHFGGDPKSINSYYSDLSEVIEDGTVSPLKPDLIGEFLFLAEWNEHIGDEKKKEWFSTLIQQEYGRTFFSRCIANWFSKASTLYEKLCSKKMAENSVENTYYAEVIYKTVCEANSDEERQKYLDVLKKWVADNPSLYLSQGFMDIYIKALLFRVEKAQGDVCMAGPIRSQVDISREYRYEAEVEVRV